MILVKCGLLIDPQDVLLLDMLRAVLAHIDSVVDNYRSSLPSARRYRPRDPIRTVQVVLKHGCRAWHASTAARFFLTKDEHVKLLWGFYRRQFSFLDPFGDQGDLGESLRAHRTRTSVRGLVIQARAERGRVSRYS